MQIEIQDYHRDQLEKDGISLPPREETVLTISGNFTKKELDKAAKKQITYRLNRDGSVILQSLRGITDKQLKRMSDDELRAIGLFKTLIGVNEKFFPTDEALSLRYQEKSKPSTAPDTVSKGESVSSLETDLAEDDIFTIDQAVAHLAKRGINVSPSTFRQKSTQLGFTVAVRGKGIYRLISD